MQQEKDIKKKKKKLEVHRKITTVINRKLCDRLHRKTQKIIVELIREFSKVSEDNISI